MKSLNRWFLLISLFISTLTGCSQAPAESSLPSAVPSSTPILPTATPLPPTATPEPTSTPFIPITGRVNVLSINLRAGPSTAHAISGTYAQGSGLKVLGTAPGGEWALVETADGQKGWMYTSLLALDGETEGIPVVEPPQSLQVTGQVMGSDGQPVGGIKIAVFEGLGTAGKYSEAVTDLTGRFYVYLPQDSQGEWTVQVIGYRCTSRIVNQNCQYAGKFLDNGITTLELPQNTRIEFIYEFPAQP